MARGTGRHLNAASPHSRAGETLDRRLRDALAEFHPDPYRISPDPQLRAFVMSLYGDLAPEEVWSRHMRPYLDAERDGLRNVMAEHADDPGFDLLDHPEALMVMERAAHDRERLRRGWPGPQSWLATLSDVWGIAI